MLKLFFVIATLTTIAKSDIEVEWICEETNSFGNCSTIPKITDWLQIISDNIDSEEYTDLQYCPYEIVGRHTRCMMTYVQSCEQYMSGVNRIVVNSYIPQTESGAIHCTKGRPYKKEFKEHTTCTKSMYNDEENQWNIHMVNQEVEFDLIPKRTNFHEKCEIYHQYWQNQSSWISKKCGPKTEKFSRHVLSNMWPIMGLLSLCGEPLSPYGYFQS